MKSTKLLMSVMFVAAVVVLSAGCQPQKLTYDDASFGPPRAVDFASDMTLEQLVLEKAQARSAYLAHLGALRDFYMQRGHWNNQQKADNELRDVGRIRVFGAMQVAPPMTQFARASEVDLVEQMISARSDYFYYLQAVNRAVKVGGEAKDISAVSREVEGLQMSRRYNYLLLADLPGPELTRPIEQNPKADELYAIARNYHNHIRLPLVYSEKNMRMALEYYNRVVREYPQSDKVDDALFYAGEILKEYFNEDDMAVEYYRRAYMADPDTPHPVRFQRAVILDYRLHRRDEALREYRAVLQYEAGKPYFWSRSNASFAEKRIQELTRR